MLAYYECPNLCTLVLNAMLTSVQDFKFDAGKEFEIVVVSFDPRETPALAAQKKKAYTQRYGRPRDNGGWHFLTGDEPAIARLAQSVGFRFAWDTQTQQYAHPSAIMVLTPEGKVSRYFAGIEYPPKELRSRWSRLGAPHRLAHRPRFPALLSLQSAHRKIRPARSCASSQSRASRRWPRWRIFIVAMSGATAACKTASAD